MDLTISIVSYNTKDLVVRCLKSIYKYTKGISFEVVVIDNGSNDSTVNVVKNAFPQVKVIENRDNLFFSKANNQALSVARGKYFLILNSDTFLVDNSFKKMIDYLNTHKNIGAVEGLELYENGKILSTGSKYSSPLIDFYELSWFGTKIKNSKLINEYRMTEKDRTKNFTVDVACDAFLMVRTKILKQIKGYDEKLLLYYTENDLCYRIKQLGFEIYHLGEAKIMHRVSASANTLGWKKNDIYYQDLRSYYLKHNYRISGTLLFLLLKTESWIFQTRDFLKNRT